MTQISVTQSRYTDVDEEDGPWHDDYWKRQVVMTTPKVEIDSDGLMTYSTETTL